MATLEKQMEAERQKRAEVTNAAAEKQAMVAISEGERQAEINLSEGEKQRRINEATGRAQSISIVATATARGTELIAEAIQKPGGSSAVKAQLVERYIETFGEIAGKADVTVMPLELANVRGFFEGMATMTGGDSPDAVIGPWDKNER
jgi:regulator of protease activity HflC (stomatin/prohibitin superfamily)